MESPVVLTAQVRALDDRIGTASARARYGLAIVVFLGLALVAGNELPSILRLVLGLALFTGSVITLGFLIQLSELAQRTRELTATLSRGLEAVAEPLGPEAAAAPAPASLEEHALAVYQRVRKEIERRHRVGEDLDRRVWEATTLYDLMLRMSADLDLEAALKMALYSSMGVFGVSEGLIFLPTADGQLEATTVRLIAEPKERPVRAPLGEELAAAVKGLPHPMPYAAIENDAVFVPFVSVLARAFPGFAPEIVCPLTAHSELVGLMLLGAKVNREPYSAENVRFLETISPAVALTIRNARSLRTLADTNRQLDRKVFELELLNEISRNLNVVGDLGDILSTVLELSARGTQAEAGAVHLFDPSTGTLNRAALCGELPQLDGAPPIALGTGLLGAVGQSLKPLVVGPGHPFGPSEISFAPESDVHSILSVPLTLERRLVGLLTMVNKSGGRAFTESDLTWMQTVSNHAASVIENLRLFKLATEDGLTGLYVHRYFQIRLREELSRGLRHGRPVSLVLVDIDHFKSINDQHGHPTGDLVLREIAKRVRANLREIDVPARYGGEEMAVILPETDAAGALVVAERIRKAIESNPFGNDGLKLAVTASLGVGSVMPDSPGRTGRTGRDALDSLARDLVEHADQAMYCAKRAGRNRTETKEPIIG
jgi:diguanylate cyclase (GGDEF)-like protein